MTSPNPPDNEDEKPPSLAEQMKSEFSSGTEGIKTKPLFQPEEMDIYVNKVTLKTHMFHGKKIDYQFLDHFEYDNNTYTVTVIYKDGTTEDLGVKIQWLVRAHFKKAKEVNIVQTKDGKTIDECVVPLVHKVKD